MEKFRISRSKIDLFLNCPKCFYLDRRLGIIQPSNFPFSLNSAVDILLKKEFDGYRIKAEAHPLMKAAGLQAVPYNHPQINLWRDSLKGGISYVCPGSNLLITGAVDDVWINPQEELIIVDYKATAKAAEVTIDASWQESYKRQMEVYQWLFRKNGFKVAETGYFLYCNGLTDREAFNQRLDFDVSLIPYQGNDIWIDGVIEDVDQCLLSEHIPESGSSCAYCLYRAAVEQAATY
ncbi:MAG: PD-(D/E)XK nuclease family protein [Candidatus Omnitrophica bacterium]|nr:PD-(D/E)XK nuclease family protein [Candidatus Omnitrophota bacterium]MDE2213805.1 PD-(D/E)XK nuclease family protein [Candidatus Omnitrophota bacterium]MDE2230618.1 PD-(D/E)XK nuclease family protein [Candidatus Omnitrophota bacterium]